MATWQSEHPGTQEKRRGSPEEKGPSLKVKRRSGTKERGGSGEEMHLQGTEPQVSLLINKEGIVPVGDG
jgi:hypothetical protein